MKIYLFFKIKEKKERIEPVLYAYTEKKHHKDTFIKTRNMNVFYMKEEKMKKMEYIEFQDKYQGKLLSDFSFVTRIDECPTNTQHIHMVTTMDEGMLVHQASDLFFNCISKDGIHYAIFSLKKKYKKILSDLSYFSIMNWYAYSELPFYELPKNDTIDLFNDQQIVVDEFQYFLKFFGETMI